MEVSEAVVMLLNGSFEGKGELEWSCRRELWVVGV